MSSAAITSRAWRGRARWRRLAHRGVQRGDGLRRSGVAFEYDELRVAVR